MHGRYNTILTNLLESYNSTCTHQDVLENLACGTLGLKKLILILRFLSGINPKRIMSLNWHLIKIFFKNTKAKPSCLVT